MGRIGVEGPRIKVTMAGQQGWLRGTVKEVLSGDTLVVAGAVKTGIPPEKRLTLASLIAPRLGRRDGSTVDEAFAWQSREFLRKLTIGKPVVFRVEYSLDQSSGRDFGSVFLNDRENLGLSVVSAGLAKVRPAGGQQSPFHEDLVRAQEQAEAKGLGLWTKDASAQAAAVREVANSNDFDAAGFLASNGKGKHVQAIVEAVLSGSMVRATLLPSLQPVTVMVAGVVCPSMGKRPEPGAAEGTQAQPEAGAREAKYYTETRVLNREVKLVVEGISQFGVLVAGVEYPVGEDGKEDLAPGLVKAGLAKGAEWSLNMMSNGAFRLREAERAARQARVGVWASYVPAPTATAKLSDDFSGVVTEVVSGDCLVVRDAASGVERRVTLSSIRTPRVGGRERAPEPWATEARELLRSRLIGRSVQVSMEYTRRVGAGPGAGDAAALAAVRGTAAGGEDRLMSFGSVTIREGERENNVAELLLVRGLASVVRHRAEEERSAHYEALMAAEEAAKAGKKAQWGSREAVIPRINDLSAPGAAARAKAHLPFLQRAGRVSGVVEFCLSAHKLKILVPKEGVALAFSPSGVKCPTRGAAAAGGRPALPEEPYWEEALAFVRDRVLQRDVELEVESVDRMGTFLGTLRVPASKLDLGAALLQAGLAKLHPSFDASRAPELAAAQDSARAKRLKVWEKYVPEEEGAPAAAEGDAAPASGPGERLEVVVTEVRDASSFYVQDAGEPRVDWIAAELAALDLEATQAQTALLRNGDKCVARYEDGQWYRASVEKVYAADPTAPEYDVFFMDFGNRQRTKAGAVRPMNAALAAVAPQATSATLAFVKAPGLEEEYGVDAAQMLAELVGSGAKLSATVESKERLQAAGKQWGVAAGVKLHLTLRSGAEEGEPSVNAKLVAAGLARLAAPKGRASSSAGLEEVRTAQEEARRRRVGLWRYGDPGSDSEEETGPKLRSAGPRR